MGIGNLALNRDKLNIAGPTGPGAALGQSGASSWISLLERSRPWSPPYVRSGLPRYAPREAVSPTVFRLADLNANGSLDLIFRNTSRKANGATLSCFPAASRAC